MRNYHFPKKSLVIFIVLILITGVVPCFSQAHCIPQGITVLPTGYTYWTNTSITVVKNIVVPAGATLQIDGGSTIYFINNVSITVQVGGALRIYGSTLMQDPTCNCSTGPWDGIVVEGNPNDCQVPVPNQGYFRILNGTISGANIGVVAMGGAHLSCEKSDFIDNRTDVLMLPYNPPNGCGCRNYTAFDECNFIWTRPFCGATDFETHVVLKGVYSVTFRACNFENTWNQTYFPGNTRGIGLQAIDASFTVDAGVFNTLAHFMTGCGENHCLNCSYPRIPSIFYGLDIGIDASWSSTGHVNTCNNTAINRSMFQDNRIAIQASDQSFFVTSICHFFYDNSTAYFSPGPVNFIINKISSIQSSMQFLYGNCFTSNAKDTRYILMADHMQPSNNYYIYKNEMRNTNVVAQSGEGIYLQNDVLTNNYIDCNTFIDLEVDIFINQGPGGDIQGGTVCHWPLPTDCSVLSQGAQVATNNTHTNSSCAGNNWNIINNSGNTVDYYIPNTGCATGGPVNFPGGMANLCELPCYTCGWGEGCDIGPPIRFEPRSYNLTVSPDIKVYPNPANNQFNIELPASENPYSISIYDMKGVLVYTMSVTETLVNMNTDKLSTGVYVIKIQNEENNINDIRKIQVIK